MSDPKYVNVGHPLTRVMEECAEVIQAGCKVQRFGWQGYNPYDPKKTTNINKLVGEMEDVTKAMADLMKYFEEECLI